MNIPRKRTTLYLAKRPAGGRFQTLYAAAAQVAESYSGEQMDEFERQAKRKLTSSQGPSGQMISG